MYGGQITPTFPTGPLPPGYLTADRGSILIGVAVSFIVLEIVAFGLRVVARNLRHLPWGWDDALMIPALIFNLALAIMSIVNVPIVGGGRHTLVNFIHGKNHEFGLMNGLIIIPILYACATVTSKAAILNLFLRIFTLGVPRRITQVLIVIIVIQVLYLVPILIFQCKPIRAAWILGDVGKCIDVIEFFKWSCLPNLITDLIMLVLPIPSVWSLNASFRVKVGVTGMLLMATIGIVASIIRTVGFFTPGHIFGDPTWYSVDLYSYTIAEPGTYFLSACFSTYRVFGRYLKKDIFRSFLVRLSLVSHPYESSEGEEKVDSDDASHKKLAIPPKPVRGFDSLMLSEIERESSNETEHENV